MKTIFLAVGLTTIALYVNNAQASENPYLKHKEVAKTAAVGTPWNAERHEAMLNKSDQLNKYLNLNEARRAYPISEADIESIFGNKETIPFFAYSSLVDKESAAAKAINPETLKSHTPAIAFGIYRTFNRAMDPKVAQNWGDLARSNDVAILNAFEKEDAVTNGVMLQLNRSDLGILCKREVGYHLVPVWVTTWKDAIESQDPKIFAAYTFIAPSSAEGSEYTSPFVNPIPGYVSYLQKGIKEFGKDFEAMWWATTYLADQKTPISTLAYEMVDCAKLN